MQGTKLFLPNVQQMAKIMKKPIWRNKLNFISQLSDFFSVVVFNVAAVSRAGGPPKVKVMSHLKWQATKKKRNWANIEKKLTCLTTWLSWYSMEKLPGFSKPERSSSYRVSDTDKPESAKIVIKPNSSPNLDILNLENRACLELILKLGLSSLGLIYCEP